MTPEQRKREEDKPLDRGKVLAFIESNRLVSFDDRDLILLNPAKFIDEINSGRLDVEEG